MSFTLQDGSTFAGRYEIVRCIASGGMGTVYEAKHNETGRRCAIKAMLPHIVSSPDLRERFKLETRVSAQIESEFIVDVFDAGIDEATGLPFLVMELLRGEELDLRLNRVGHFSPVQVVTYLHQTALALDKTHKANIVHRDLKPENLFLTERDDGSPRIKVLDFGIAKIVADGSTEAAVTRNFGTPFYMSPEQFLGDGLIGPPSDIYALGMLAFTLLTGEAYWASELRANSNMYAFCNTAVLGPKEAATVRAARLGVTLPPEFDAWFSTITASLPADRFPTATAATRALAQVFGIAGLASGATMAGGVPETNGAVTQTMTPSVAQKQTPVPQSRKSLVSHVLVAALIALPLIAVVAFVLVRSQAVPSADAVPTAQQAAVPPPAAAPSTAAPAPEAPEPAVASAAVEPAPAASASAEVAAGKPATTAKPASARAAPRKRPVSRPQPTATSPTKVPIYSQD